MEAGSAYYCKRVTYVVVANVEADIPLVRVNTQVGYGLSQFSGVSVQRSIFTVLLPTGGQVTCSQLVQVPVLLNAVDEFWARLPNTFDGVVNVDFIVGDQLIHHVHHCTEQPGAFDSVKAVYEEAITAAVLLTLRQL